MKNQKKLSDSLDEELWDLVIKKDQLAFEHLYRRYYSALLAYGISFQKTEELAKDCIQDLFVKLFSSESLSPVKYVRAYLYSSYRNMLLNKINTDIERLEESSLQMLTIEDNELIKLFAGDDEFLKKSRLVADAYHQLTVNQRNAIYLFYIKEFSWDEMAVSLSISSHSCMNLVARSVAKLKKTIKKEKSEE